MNEIPDDSVNLILCDLPYGTTKCKWDTIKFTIFIYIIIYIKYINYKYKLL